MLKYNSFIAGKDYTDLESQILFFDIDGTLIDEEKDIVPELNVSRLIQILKTRK